MLDDEFVKKTWPSVGLIISGLSQLADSTRGETAKWENDFSSEGSSNFSRSPGKSIVALAALARTYGCLLDTYLAWQSLVSLVKTTSFCHGRQTKLLSALPGSPIRQSTPRFTTTNIIPKWMVLSPVLVMHWNDTGIVVCPNTSKGNLLAPCAVSVVLFIPILLTTAKF